ncbi:MAG TPA: tetratricopeptide repeat protein [Thermodesulfobacteriota bacterium]|nr:tetratricopeptide repeat protein [Thermodesulfobacteriota bacterium]
MERLSKYRSLRLTLIMLSVAAAVLAIRSGTSSVLALGKDSGSLERSVSLDPRNAEAKYRLGRLYQLDMSGSDEHIETLYKESIEENPLYSPSWLGLAELYADSGENDKARAALAMADGLIPSSAGLLWDSSMLSLSLGDTARALGKLRKVAGADPARRERVFDICRDMGIGGETMLDEVVTPEALPAYLRYLIRKDIKAETYSAWDRAKRSGAADKGLALAYVDYLINKGDVNTARYIWDGVNPGRDGSGVWNGGFEEDTMDRGFDWRIQKAEGVETEYDYRNKTEGERSLRVRFTGDANVDFSHVWQIVPVKPRTHYLLVSDISTEDLTTRNGVAWDVYCKGMDSPSEMYTGSVGWTETRVEFDTPPGCSYVGIRLRREKSDKLDNLISGDVWIDNVRLINLGPVTDA